VTDPLLAAAIDEALAVRLLLEMNGNARETLPPGMAYANESDYDDAGEAAEIARMAKTAA
jgi:hypothetical protein